MGILIGFIALFIIAAGYFILQYLFQLLLVIQQAFCRDCYCKLGSAVVNSTGNMVIDRQRVTGFVASCDPCTFGIDLFFWKVENL